MFGELVRWVSNTRIFIDLHLPRLTHLHDARRLSHVRGVSVWILSRGAILKSPAINRKGLVITPWSGSGVGFAVGDREQQVGSWELRGVSSGTASVATSPGITPFGRSRGLSEWLREDVFRRWRRAHEKGAGHLADASDEASADRWRCVY